jgi:dienelactone hydrolase
MEGMAGSGSRSDCLVSADQRLNGHSPLRQPAEGAGTDVRGESDKYKDCCLIGTARALGAAATAANQPFELFTYPKTDHDFVQGGGHYNPAAYKDALDKTAAKLKEFLGN